MATIPPRLAVTRRRAAPHLDEWPDPENPITGRTPGAAGDGPEPPFSWARLSDDYEHYWACQSCPEWNDVITHDDGDAITHARATGHRVRIIHTHTTTITGVMI